MGTLKSVLKRTLTRGPAIKGVDCGTSKVLPSFGLCFQLPYLEQAFFRLLGLGETVSFKVRN